MLKAKLLIGMVLALLVVTTSTIVAQAKPGGGGGCAPVDGVITVSPTSNCSTIQDAVNAAPGTAESPTVIDVLPGIYVVDATTKWAVDIANKSHIHLRGAGRDVTHLTGGDVIGFQVYLSNNIEISGISYSGGIDGASSACIGFFVVNASDVKISDSQVQNTGSDRQVCEGIGVMSSTNVTISSNLSNSNQRGFTQWENSSNVNLTGNTLTGNTEADVAFFYTGTNASFNIFDTVSNGANGDGSYNVDSNGNPKSL